MDCFVWNAIFGLGCIDIVWILNLWNNLIPKPDRITIATNSPDINVLCRWHDKSNINFVCLFGTFWKLDMKTQLQGPKHKNHWSPVYCENDIKISYFNKFLTSHHMVYTLWFQGIAVRTCYMLVIEAMYCIKMLLGHFDLLPLCWCNNRQKYNLNNFIYLVPMLHFCDQT